MKIVRIEDEYMAVDGWALRKFTWLGFRYLSLESGEWWPRSSCWFHHCVSSRAAVETALEEL